MWRAVLWTTVAAALVAPAAPAADARRPVEPGERASGVSFVERRLTLELRTPAYGLTLAKRNGAVVSFADEATGATLLTASGCLWNAVVRGAESDYLGGCRFRPGGRDRFSYRWSRATSTLTLTYSAAREGSRAVDAVVTLTARPTFLDLHLALRNRAGGVLGKVGFPSDLLGSVEAVEAGYAPTFLPGVRLKPAFFARAGNDVFTYPSRWAFADYLALDIAGGHVSLSSVNPRPSAIHPVELGFVHNRVPEPCSCRVFCVVHAFRTWVPDGRSWESPTVRLRIGGGVRQTVLAYREDNRIDEYPTVREKLGARLEALARAPLVKADLWKGLRPFAEWAPDLRRLPSPALLHPVSFQPRGHDESFPDFLPPDPRWGSLDDLRAAVVEARRLGLLVMPYLNVSWWDDESPTLASEHAPPIADLAVRDERGRPVLEGYRGHDGVVVSPHPPFVRSRVERLIEEWRRDVPVDCLFFDQIGARPWLRDFNPAAPAPESYYDGWLGLMAPFADRCLMVEDGWDRLAASFSGFHGGMLMMERESDEVEAAWGSGTFEPYPLALWLFHENVLLYQHDLFEGTFTVDREVLTWNAAFGLMLSYAWEGQRGTLESPWLRVVADFQRALGPLVAGRALTGYRRIAERVSESEFGGLKVIANWDRDRGHTVSRYGLAPQGFLARTSDGSLTAGVFEGVFDGALLAGGPHYLVVERDATSVTIRQPLGVETALTVDPPSLWRPGMGLEVRALPADGTEIARTAAAVRSGRLELLYRRTLDGREVAAYRISAV
ncbi:MAG: DUF6259 domain-containing protein [Gaiellaceae bacterium]